MDEYYEIIAIKLMYYLYLELILHLVRRLILKVKLLIQF